MSIWTHTPCARVCLWVALAAAGCAHQTERDLEVDVPGDDSAVVVPDDAHDDDPPDEDAPDDDTSPPPPPVTAPSVQVWPEVPSALDPLRCAPVDAPDTVLDWVVWRVDGLVAGHGPTLAPGVAVGGDEVACRALVTASDGQLREVQSDPVVLANTPPSIRSVTATPSTALPGDVLTCAADGLVDVDGEEVGVTLRWLLDGVEVATGPTWTVDGPQAAQPVCEATPSDGVAVGTPVVSSPVVVVDPTAGGNVLVLIADDMGIDQLDAYGVAADAPHTPHLDALAAHGVTFTRAWSNPNCSPTRATMITGQEAFRTGVGWPISEPTNQIGLALDEVTLPELLRTQSPLTPLTGMFGKWHLSVAEPPAVEHPELQGFDVFSGTGGNLYGRWNPFEGSTGFYRFPWYENGLERLVQDTYVTTHTVDRALHFLSQAPQTWMAWVSFHAPHHPFHVPPDHLHTTGATASSDKYLKYDAAIEAMDAEIGRLLAGLPPDTTVIFLADNGTPSKVAQPPYSEERSKFSVYEGGVRVPLIVRSPLVAEPGRTEDALVRLTDLFPTLAEILGVPHAVASTGTDGVSLLGHLVDPHRPPAREFVYTEVFRHQDLDPQLPFTDHEQAIRDDRYKLVRRLDRPDELYDLGHDAAEGPDLLTAGPLTAGPLSADAAAAYARLADALDRQIVR